VDADRLARRRGGRTLTLGVVQCALGGAREANLDAVETLVREAEGQGAQVIVTPELLEGPYFCKTQDEAAFALAAPIDGHPALARFSALAKELGVVLPVSVFEREGPRYYNALAMIDANGANLGVYRKTHIPDGPGYQEKFYFRPGAEPPRVWGTAYGRIGAGICWDQWYPEVARLLALGGAEAIIYPSAIGEEPQAPGLDTSERWRRVMQGHAAANVVPVVASNRVGVEDGQAFYGCAFIADQTGAIAAEVGRDQTGVAVATFDLDAIEQERAAWGFFRDRRSDLYGPLAE
jgi:N-carbamoylputrescine amidase